MRCTARDFQIRRTYYAEKLKFGKFKTIMNVIRQTTIIYCIILYYVETCILRVAYSISIL